MDQITTSVDQITTSVDQITYLNYYSSGSKYYISGYCGSNFILQKLMMHQMYDWNSYLVDIVHTDSSSCVFLHRNHNTKATGSQRELLLSAIVAAIDFHQLTFCACIPSPTVVMCACNAMNIQYMNLYWTYL